MSDVKNLIVAVDFDGTLVEDNFPEIGKPIPYMIEAVKELKDMGTKIILWTCRNGEALTQAVDYCRDILHIEFDAVNENLDEVKAEYGGDTRKVFADYYLDDKSAHIDRVLSAAVSRMSYNAI